MNEKELEGLLAKKEQTGQRDNVALVLSPDITRNAMRLKKRRRDRLQALACGAAAALFLLAAGGMSLYLKNSEQPEIVLRPVLTLCGGGMGLTLLLAPALVWFSGPRAQDEN